MPVRSNLLFEVNHLDKMLITQHQLLDDYTIRRAELNHYDVLLNLFLEAATWLRSNGIRQWGHFLDGYGRDDVMDSIEGGTAFVVEKDDIVIGTVTVLLSRKTGIAVFGRTSVWMILFLFIDWR